VSKDLASTSRGRRGGRGTGIGRGQNWAGPNNSWGGMFINFNIHTICNYVIHNLVKQNLDLIVICLRIR